MNVGRVIWFNPERGYGFISAEDGKNVFVHFSEILGDGYRMLHKGEMVEFEIIDTAQGLQAKNVRRLGLSKEPPDLDAIDEFFRKTG